MTASQSAYLEEFALFFEQLGLTRAAGRIFAYLLIAPKEFISFQDFDDALHMSRGSLSMTLKSLEQLNFVEKVSLPGDRKTYYRFRENAFDALMAKRNQMLMLFADKLNKGLALRANPTDEPSQRIRHMSEFFVWLTQQMDELILKWNTERSSS